MSYASRVDTNHAAIITALRQLGWLVQSTAMVPGWIDVVAYRPSHGVVLLELKTGTKAKLTPSQQALIAAGWPIVRLSSVDEAIYFSQGRQPRRQNNTY